MYLPTTRWPISGTIFTLTAEIISACEISTRAKQNLPFARALPQSSRWVSSCTYSCHSKPGTPTDLGRLGGPVETLSHPGDGQRAEGLSLLLGIATEAGDDRSHIISPAMADDSEFLESYLSAIPIAQRRYLVRNGPSSDRPPRPVRFNLVPRRPLGVTANQSLASSKCEIIENYMDPDLEEYMKL